MPNSTAPLPCSYFKVSSMIIKSGISKVHGYVFELVENKWNNGQKTYTLIGENAKGKKIYHTGSWSLLANIIGNN
jgi:hypothetical protein